MEDNPYRGPIFSDPPATGVSSLSEAEIRAFVGRNAGYYLRKWPVGADDRGPARGFNWAAFLLNAFWISYRKMYRLALIFYSVIGVTTVLAIVLEPAGRVGELAHLPGTASSASSSRSFAAFFGNAWYLAHASAKTGRRLASRGHRTTRGLARRGGTNLLAAIGLYVLLIAVIAFVIFDHGFLGRDV